MKSLVHPSSTEVPEFIPTSYEAFKAEDAFRQHKEMMEEAYGNAAEVKKKCQSFAEFVKKAWHVIEPGTPLKWSWHLQAMCDHLEAIRIGRAHV